MVKGVIAGLLYIAACAAAYMLLRLGMFLTTGLGLDSLSINAFLFLTGLGGALTLLSPTLPSRRLR